MYVIGTAGHVDHGKSTLVRALTGIDPDRLAEEKAREMTIDLGFAWLNIDGEDIGIVDVPGHRDFIENMLAGVGGIDLALFVIAADEGVMPQTREHLAILDLLGIHAGVIALTKVDLIDDPDWLELVILEIGEIFEDTVLADAPIIPVSAHSGEGLDELKTRIIEILQETGSRQDNGRPRLPIDRVFTLSGFGTVVTGTLLDGQFHVGDTIEILPGKRNGRIRGLQTHKQKLDVVYPGSRVAINLTGIDKQVISRGDIVAAPGVIAETILLDVAYRQLPDAISPLKHNSEVKLFIGAAETIARARVLGAKQIDPGEEGWLQLALQQPIAMLRGDRFILRRPSPAATIGGGIVLDPHPGRRHRRFKAEVITHLQTLSTGSPHELMLQNLQRIEPATELSLIQQSGLESDHAESVLADLIQTGQVRRIGNQIISFSGWESILLKTKKVLNDYHQKYPLRLGIPREEFRSRLRLSPALFGLLLSEGSDQELLVNDGTTVRLPDHAIEFSAAQQLKIDRLLSKFAAAGVNAPSVKEAKAEIGEDLYFALLDLGKLNQLNSEVVYASPEYEQYIGQIKSYLTKNQRINAAQTRDLLNTSRKYAIAMLEHLDDLNITKRVDDYRILTSL